jgi:hypothetical protein
MMLITREFRKICFFIKYNKSKRKKMKISANRIMIETMSGQLHVGSYCNFSGNDKAAIRRYQTFQSHLLGIMFVLARKLPKLVLRMKM